ncbi:hypothetical protein RI367_004609 [Sorochytrium milnesiophthora]
MPPAPHAASSHLLQQIPLWRRLPRELQHAVLERTNIATTVRVQDENMAQLLVKRDLCIADMATQRAWWTAVLETSWLPGAKILLDAYVPYLPVLQEDALAPTPEILQLLLANEMVLPPDSPIPEPGQQLTWQLDNIETLMTLVCRLSSDTPQRSKIRGDIEMLDMLKYEPDIDHVLHCLLPGDESKQHAVKIAIGLVSQISLTAKSPSGSAAQLIRTIHWRALWLALEAGQTEAVTFLTEHYPTAVASLRHMDCSRCLQVAALRGDVATLDWFLAHHPAVFTAASRPFDQSLFPPAVWEWLIDHPEHAAWALDPQIPHSDMSLYDKLTPRRPRQAGAGYYFAQSAIAANDIEWLRQVSSNFDTPIDRYCDTDLLYKTEHLSLLQQLCDQGHLAIPPDAVLQFLAHENLAGAHWVLRRHWRDDLELHPVMYADDGHLATLQFVLGKRDMCLQCLVNAAKRAGQHHVLAWCRDQRQDVWTPCESHKA